MDLTCPHCRRPISPTDRRAGRASRCPGCRGVIAIPGPVDSSSAADSPPPPAEPAAAVPVRLAFSLNAKALRWAPLACLCLALVLMLFPWVGLYAGGRTLQGQTGMGVAFQSCGTDLTDHEGLRARLQEFFSRDPNLSPAVGVPTLLYFLATVLAVLAGVVLIAAGFSRVSAARRVLPWRGAAFAGLSVAALLLLSLQLVVGFPLENQYLDQVEKDTAALRTKAVEVEGPERQARLDWVEIQHGVKESLPRRTVWLWLAFLANLAAVAAALRTVWWERQARPVAPRSAAGQPSPLAPGAIRSTS